MSGLAPLPHPRQEARKGCPRNTSKSNGGLDGNVLKLEVELGPLLKDFVQMEKIPKWKSLPNLKGNIDWEQLDQTRIHIGKFEDALVISPKDGYFDLMEFYSAPSSEPRGEDDAMASPNAFNASSVPVDSVLSADFWFHPRILPSVRKATDAAKSADGLSSVISIDLADQVFEGIGARQLVVKKEPAFFNPPEEKVLLYTHRGELPGKLLKDEDSTTTKATDPSIGPYPFTGERAGKPAKTLPRGSLLSPTPLLMDKDVRKETGNDQSPFAWRSVSVHGTSFNRPFQSLGKIVKLLNYLSMIRRMRPRKEKFEFAMHYPVQPQSPFRPECSVEKQRIFPASELFRTNRIAPAEAIVAAEVAKLPIRYRRKRHAVLKELCHKFIRTAICRASIASSPLVRYQAYSLEGDRWPQTCKSQLFVHIQAFVPHTEMKTFKDVMEGLKVIGAGTTTIALAGAAVGIGKIFSFALTEAIALFTLMMAFLILFLSEEVRALRKRRERKLDRVSLLCWLMPNHLQEGKEVNFITFSIISSSSGRIETIKIQVGIRLSTCLSTSEHSVQVPQRSTTWLGQIFTHYPSSNLLVCIAPNYKSDPADEKENSALLLSRWTYPPRDSWNFCGLRWGKSTKARQIDRLLSRC
ncbi:ATP synthase F0 subunit 9, mitochondrial [Tanacetum coccineum]